MARNAAVMAINIQVLTSLLKKFDATPRGKVTIATITGGVLAASINSCLLKPFGMFQLYPLEGSFFWEGFKRQVFGLDS